MVELKFNVVDMTAAEDFESLLFEGNWKAIQAPQCTKEMRYQGPSGIIIFSYPQPAEEVRLHSITILSTNLKLKNYITTDFCF